MIFWFGFGNGLWVATNVFNWIVVSQPTSPWGFLRSTPNVSFWGLGFLNLHVRLGRGFLTNIFL